MEEVPTLLSLWGLCFSAVFIFRIRIDFVFEFPYM